MFRWRCFDILDGLLSWCLLRHFQQYLSYIVAVSFIGIGTDYINICKLP